MDILPKPLIRVIESFEKLPGIGPKSAQRLAFYLLHMPQEELNKFGDNIQQLKKLTTLCAICKNTTEESPCIVCRNPTRDQTIICVVEQPTDVLSVEKTGTFKGLYHVLHGCIDPLNNIGPDELFLSHLLVRIDKSPDIKEIIVALNPTMEGEATAVYLQKEIQKRAASSHVLITRLAHGIPIGADIEYADEVTLRKAMEGRRSY